MGGQLLYAFSTFDCTVCLLLQTVMLLINVDLRPILLLLIADGLRPLQKDLLQSMPYKNSDLIQ